MPASLTPIALTDAHGRDVVAYAYAPGRLVWRAPEGDGTWAVGTLARTGTANVFVRGDQQGPAEALPAEARAVIAEAIAGGGT